MIPDYLLTEINSLPPSLQQEVADYAAFLRARYLHGDALSEPLREKQKMDVYALRHAWHSDDEGLIK